MGTAHLDEVKKRRNERGQMAGTWSNLGTAAGSSRAGASRIELAPGEQPTPPHVHGQAAEIFYVLAGSGLTLLDDDAYEIRAGDCIVYRNLHEEHTIRAGEEGLDVIAFGAREDLPAGELPSGGSGPDPDRLGHPRPERHLLVSALQEDLLARGRRDRPDRAAGLLGWRIRLIRLEWGIQ